MGLMVQNHQENLSTFQAQRNAPHSADVRQLIEAALPALQAHLSTAQQINGQVEDLEHWIRDEREYAEGQLISWLFGAFALLALALASVGLYSVVSYTVAQRTNEFGIRIALGAQRTHVLKIVFASIMVSVGSGIAIGLGLTLALHKVMAQWAEGSSRDPLILLAVTLLLGLVAGIACCLPAKRAVSVDPMTALRYE